ncbi:MAG: FG-GAP-like repeat-containing protein [Actinomycetes bacterium]
MTQPRTRPVSSLRRLAAIGVAFALGAAWFVNGPTTSAHAVGTKTHKPYAHACGKAPRGHARCDALYQTAPATKRTVSPNTAPPGYGPIDLQDAYNLPSGRGGVGRIVAIVDAFNWPAAESSLAAYRTQFGLPSCTTNNGCFLKIGPDPNDPSALPPTQDPGWAVEMALDLDMVSASCPNCAIVLVEATDDSLVHLANAALTAAGYAEAISNSYGVAEGNFSQSPAPFDSFYSVPGIVYTASTGDDGYGPQYPATSPDVVAVGGTSLTQDASARGWNETTWFDPTDNSGTGSGCSLYEAKPSWQSDACTHRTEADVSAVADPNTGVASYGPFPGCSPDPECWGILGGTSASAPLIAGAYMVAGGAPVQRAARLLYDRGGAHLNDVTSGANTASCTDGYLCTAGPGYDGPTGMGTPNGSGAMRNAAGVAQFDALGNTQFSVYRPSTQTWYVRGSHFYPQAWGKSGDKPVPADYFGDTFTDAAVYRPSTHQWFIQFLGSFTWGTTGDIPVPGDFSGDGVAELTVYRPSNHTWYEHNLVSVSNTTVPWGASADTPVPGDYDGDGKIDPATYRPSTNTWYIKGISGTTSWGKRGDVPVPGDYNGDGKTDIAVYRPSTHTWYLHNLGAPVAWGGTGDAPEPGDYNGDGKTDIATWRPSNQTWYVRGIPGATVWGKSGDVPLVLPYAIDRTR